MPWKQIEHEFTHPQLNYDSKPNFQRCIKVSVYFKKIDSIDHDTFFGHWRTVHADLATATKAFKDHIVRYAQVGRNLYPRNDKTDKPIAPSNPRDEGEGSKPWRERAGI